MICSGRAGKVQRVLQISHTMHRDGAGRRQFIDGSERVKREWRGRNFMVRFCVARCGAAFRMCFRGTQTQHRAYAGDGPNLLGP
jgi:hypothetical protein